MWGFLLYFVLQLNLNFASDKDDKNASEDCSEAQGFPEHLCNVDDV